MKCLGNSWNHSLPHARAGRSIFVLAACAFVWIGLLTSSLAHDREPGVVASVVRPAHPVLIRNQHSPMLRVMIDVPTGQTARLTSLEFAMNGTDDLNDIEAIQLFGAAKQECL